MKLLEVTGFDDYGAYSYEKAERDMLKDWNDAFGHPSNQMIITIPDATWEYDENYAMGMTTVDVVAYEFGPVDSKFINWVRWSFQPSHHDMEFSNFWVLGENEDEN
jgi:hypothetical protein